MQHIINTSCLIRSSAKLAPSDNIDATAMDCSNRTLYALPVRGVLKAVPLHWPMLCFEVEVSKTVSQQDAFRRVNASIAQRSRTSE